MDASAVGSVVGDDPLEMCRGVANRCNDDLEIIDNNRTTVVERRTETLDVTFPHTADKLPSSSVNIENTSLNLWMMANAPSLRFEIDCRVATRNVVVESWDELRPAVTELMTLATELQETMKDASSSICAIAIALGDIHVVSSSARQLIGVHVDKDPSPRVEQALELCAEAHAILALQFPDATLHISTNSSTIDRLHTNTLGSGHSDATAAERALWDMLSSAGCGTARR